MQAAWTEFLLCTKICAPKAAHWRLRRLIWRKKSNFILFSSHQAVNWLTRSMSLTCWCHSFASQKNDPGRGRVCAAFARGHRGTSFASARVRARYLFAWVDKRASQVWVPGGRAECFFFFFLSALSFRAPPAALLLLGTAPVDFSLTSSNCTQCGLSFAEAADRTNPCALTSSLTTLHKVEREWCFVVPGGRFVGFSSHLLRERFVLRISAYTQVTIHCSGRRLIY